MKYNLEEKNYGWRTLLYNELNKEHINGDVYQFGVAGGFSMQVLGKLCKKIKCNPCFFGFDVFSGMPVEKIEPDAQKDIPGEFNQTKVHGVICLSDAIKMIIHDIQCELNYNTKLYIIEGLVEDTLNEDFIKKYSPKPALYIDFDLDIYSPTKYVFDFMIKNKLILPGTIIGFDDWNQHWTPDFIFGAHGENRAFKEITEQYKLKTRPLFATQNQEQIAFLVI